MDILDEVAGSPEEDFSLESLLGDQPKLAPLPKSAVRNRAATTAMLTDDPEKMTEQYTLMMQEQETGQDVLGSQLRSRVVEKSTQMDMKGVMDILADPTIPMEQKKSAIDAIKQSQMLKDQGSTLYTSSLQNASANETAEAEDARLSSVDAIRDIYQARQDVQGLVNAHAASLNGDINARSVGELTELYVMPFGNSLNVAKIKNAQGASLWKTIKSFILPGSATADIREHLESVPPEKRVEYARGILETIQQNSGILLSNENQFAQYDKAISIFEQGGYGSLQEFVDNVSPLLDVIGIGQVMRGVAKTNKVATVASTVPTLEARIATDPVVSNSPQVFGGRSDAYKAEREKIKTPSISEAAKQERVDALIEKRANMLGDSSTLAEKGDIKTIQSELAALTKPVESESTIKLRAKELQSRNGLSYKEATKAAKKEIGDDVADYEATKQRLTNQLEANRKAASNEQRLADLDKEISSLQSKLPANPGSTLTPLADSIRRIELNSIVRMENPTAPAYIIQQANPQQSRAIHSTVVKSGTDEVAEGLHGTSREQAIINDVYPQVDSGSGRITSKPIDLQRDLRKELQVSDELVNLINNTGATYYTKGEKASARANIVNDFANAQGMAINEAMSSFKLDGGRVVVGAVYGTPEGAFSNAVDAFRQARLALRQYGVLDSEITVLRKEGLDHVPIKLADEVPDGPGNYLVRVDTSHEFDPTDFSNLESFNVKRNFFDRVPQLVGKNNGSLTRNILDAASTLHPTYTGAAAVASDATAKFERVMLSLADEYAKKVTKFDSARKNKIDEYIREANYNEIKFDQSDLVARGFTGDEIDALSSWRKFWDAHYYLENYDVIRTLSSQGYAMFKNQNTELYAKPVPKNQNLGGIYDPATDTVVFHSKADGDALYASGGTYAKLRRPAQFGPDVTEHMIVRNSPTEYLRKFRGTDSVLNYRDGYFQLQYKAPKFVDEIDSSGASRTVAVAGDTAEADHFAARMRTTTGKEYRVRGDDKAIRKGDDTWWDVNAASGRIAQKHRGKLLEDASGLNHLGNGDYIVNPVDSAIRAARSISGRTVNRPMLEAAKARFMNQYSRLLPSNEMGGHRYPSSVKEIGSKGEHVSSDLADARTTFEYINYLENGYINAIDDTFKAGMNAISEMLGKAHLSKLERGAASVANLAPTSLAKNGVFMAYIGSNIFRQLIIQPHQIVRTFAYNPTGWATGGIQKLMADFVSHKMNLNGGTAFGRFVEDSGFMDAVDKTNLVRGTLTDAADSTNKAIRTVGKVTNFSRKIGFDMGENANMLGHSAAVYDRYTRAGKDLTDKAVRDEAFAEIRAISYDMNFAGDMPYNQTSPAMLLQFMQVPHKAFLQMTNRKLDRTTRAKLVAGDLILWGAPIGTISAIMGKDILPDNPDLKEAFQWGVESWAINAALSQLVEDRVDIDFSSLAPYELTGWGKFMEGMWSGGLHDLLLNSPAGALFFKDGSRAQNAIKSLGRYFGMVDDDQEAPETFLSVMHETAKMSSGYSNAYKAKLLLEAKKRLDQYGNVIDSNVNHVEAWAQLLGFGTADTRDLYRISLEMSKDTKAHKDEVLKVYEDIKRYYAEKLNVEATDPEYITKITGRILSVYKDDPAAQAIIYQKLSMDMAGKESQLISTFLKRSGIPDLRGLRDQVRQMPVSDDQKALMLQRIDDMEAARNQIKEVK